MVRDRLVDEEDLKLFNETPVFKKSLEILIKTGVFRSDTKTFFCGCGKQSIKFSDDKEARKNFKRHLISVCYPVNDKILPVHDEASVDLSVGISSENVGTKENKTSLTKQKIKHLETKLANTNQAFSKFVIESSKKTVATVPFNESCTLKNLKQQLEACDRGFLVDAVESYYNRSKQGTVSTHSLYTAVYIKKKTEK